MNVKIKGKLNLRELAHVGMALGIALVLAFIIYGLFALLSLMSWLIVVFIIAVILTPIIYWGIKWYKEELDIDTSETKVEERPDCIRISDAEGE